MVTAGTQRSGFSAIEQVLLWCQSRNKTIIGLTAAHSGAGVTTSARALASVAAQSGYHTLLLDLSKTILTQTDNGNWKHGSTTGLAGLVERPLEFDVLSLNITLQERFRFNRPNWIRETLRNEVGLYEFVVVDLPPVLDGSNMAVNPAAAATACDGLLLVCEVNRTLRREMRAAVEILAAAGHAPDGIVINTWHATSLAIDLSRRLESVRRIAPGFVARLQAWMLRSSLLN